MNVKSVGSLLFPEPSDIVINMMPFVMGDRGSVPEEFSEYLPRIDDCKLPESEMGKVGYLTIHESMVEKGESQRRPGLHTEKNPKGAWGGGSWGGRGGLYMGSDVRGSCRVWDEYVDYPGDLGDCEHIRSYLGDGILLEENELVWLTDGTPHEALPASEDTYRQFFRLITSDVSVWYSAHSTGNRLGIMPECRVMHGSKF